ncbi:hypothetical protein [Pseudonocardia sp. WMMC193]|uniref:hypothetical protein n=1 Tax=Pseudonocardia sp. WMMC193 TaxID=2911965 RepID=UPI001F221D5F|nr:hypothetical protein [Pseudonocardia sp. WMMC193]MCF7553780.1 hypothetical protein [Pseudonocardia sp. WMMC193]
MLLDPAYSEYGIYGGQKVLDLAEICSERLSVCVASYFAERDDIESAQRVSTSIGFVPNAGTDGYPQHALWPFMPETALRADKVEMLRHAFEAIEQVWQGRRPAGRLFYDDEIAVLFFQHRRYASAMLAQRAFEIEAEMTGPLDYSMLEARSTRQIFSAEILGLLGLWHPSSEVRSAAVVAGSGLRSAQWLWLEDDDRAMGVLRDVLESLARIRAHLRKPEAAVRLEARGASTSPRDWLKLAGWKRLQPLNYALGDLSHLQPSSHWGGSRDLLVALMPPGTDPKLAPYRGRGATLEAIVSLAGHTAIEAVDGLSPGLGVVMRELAEKVGLFDKQREAAVEDWLDRAWDHRQFDYGGPTLARGPAAQDDVFVPSAGAGESD